MRSKYTLNRSSRIVGSFTIILITVFLLGIEGGIFSAKAIDCGDTIGPGEIAILDHDLGPCKDEDQILEVEGPALLNLNGFTVTCAEQEDKDGILVTGKRAIILNGTITDCDIGVHVRGDGHHKIFNLTVEGYYDSDGERVSTGIRVRSDSVKNHIFKNTALHNDRGFRVQADNNRLIHNFAELNNKGIRVEGEHNTVVWNKANNNDSENFQIRGAYNRIVYNSANGGDQECFLIEGNYNSLSKNSARDCEDGFVLSNEEDEGGDNNRIFNCKAIGNRTNGIVAGDGAIDNRIIHNKAFFNGFDLVDENVDCDNNVWKRNKFFSSHSDNCISNSRI